MCKNYHCFTNKFGGTRRMAKNNREYGNDSIRQRLAVLHDCGDDLLICISTMVSASILMVFA